MSREAPIERLLDQEVEWEPIPLEGCSFVDDPDAVYATHQGTLEIGVAKLRCYQLNDGQPIEQTASFCTLEEYEARHAGEGK